jgi:hypothetical protein
MPVGTRSSTTTSPDYTKSILDTIHILVTADASCNNDTRGILLEAMWTKTIAIIYHTIMTTTALRSEDEFCEVLIDGEK